MCAEPATNPEEIDPFTGRQLAAYRLGALIGRGAMGRVYAAEHAVLGRRVAIKVLEAQLVADQVAVRRFVDEVRAVTAIRHPNIIDITDFGEIEGQPYFVMELLDGETLGARIETWGRLKPSAAVKISIQVASGLMAAHERGVIHRDLKPDNIFLSNHPDYPDRVKVLDFGVAKLNRPANHGDGNKPATQLGLLLGTPLYMSPEQSLGDAIDHRTDIYALGVVLYESVTGVSPFDRPTLQEILLAHVHDAPASPRTIEPTIPEALDAVIMRALEKSPAARFDDMRQMRSALVACHRDMSPMQRSMSFTAPELSSLTPPPPVAVAAPPAKQAAPVATVALTAPAAAPTESARLGSFIAATLRDIILKRIADNRLVLPALPGAITEALRVLHRPDANLKQVAEALQQDPLISAQLLRVATSVAYRASVVPATVQQAMVRIGVARLRTLLYELSVRRVFASPRPSFATAFRSMWQHSLVVATLARQVCEQLGNPIDPASVHLGGLLHDVGKPLIGVMLFEAEKHIGPKFRIDQDTWIDIVDQSHREVAVSLAGKWRLSSELQHVIACSDSYHGEPSKLATNIVCFANAMAKHAGHTVGPVDSAQVEALVAEGADRLGLDWRFVFDLRTGIQGFTYSDEE